MPFIESLRLLANSRKSDFCFVHLSMIICLDQRLSPIDSYSDPENQKNYKTKPTQHSVRKLREQGINPDILVMRTPRFLDNELMEKLSVHCGIDQDKIISNVDVPNIYYVPRIFESQGMFEKINQVLGFESQNLTPPMLRQYDQIIEYYDMCKTHVSESDAAKKYKLVIIGKYTGTQDTYLSVIRAVEHAVFKVNQDLDQMDKKFIVQIEVIDAEKIDMDDMDFMNSVNACIIAGGFGARGIGGKMIVSEYCRKNNIPALGICLGMQVMVCEFAKNVCGLNALSEEWVNQHHNQSADPLTRSLGLTEKTGDLVVCLLPDQSNVLGGTMRLGNYETKIQVGSMTHRLYGSDLITERHRHRYEINNMHVDLIESQGLKFVGTGLGLFQGKDSDLMEITELPGHKFYIGSQFHPEFKSRYNKPHPLFIGLIKAMI
jgi:CTP synthase